MAVSAVTKDNFKQEVLDHKGLVMIDFYADWCAPCKVTSPIIEELSEEIKDMKFVKLDVDSNSDIASQYSVFSIPTFMIFKDGKMVEQFIGAMGKEGFLTHINRAKAS